MDKSVLDMLDRMRHQKLGLTTSESRDVQGFFDVKLCAWKVDSLFFTQFPLN